MIFGIVHYNTPKLTSALCDTIIKFHPGSNIVVFDNSNRYPFEDIGKCMLIDNTGGKCIDFRKELACYPEKYISEQILYGSRFGSVKHSMSVQKLFCYIGRPFILLDSDVLLKKPIDDIVDESMACVSDVDATHIVPRIYPFIAFMNVPLIEKNHLVFFDPKRMYSLCSPNSTSYNYDTGASFYEDVVSLGLHKRINYGEYVHHYGKGSWDSNRTFKNNAYESSCCPVDDWISKNMPI